MKRPMITAGSLSEKESSFAKFTQADSEARQRLQVLTHEMSVAR